MIAIEQWKCGRCGLTISGHIPSSCPSCAINDSRTEASLASSQQIGGDHYKHLAIQPFLYCEMNRLSKLEGDVVAYVTRWRKKGGVEDLRKAKHSIDLLIEIEANIKNLDMLGRPRESSPTRAEPLEQQVQATSLDTLHGVW